MSVKAAVEEAVAPSVVMAGAVTASPDETVPRETTMVLDPVRAVCGLTVILAAAPGPVAVLRVSVRGPVTFKTVGVQRSREYREDHQCE